MSETTAPVLDADIPSVPENEPQAPESHSPEPASRDEDTKAAEGEEACVVVKEDSTPRGRRLANEAREVAAAHATLLVDIEACKRVSMSRRSPLLGLYMFVSFACGSTNRKPFGSLKIRKYCMFGNIFNELKIFSHVTRIVLITP